MLSGYLGWPGRGNLVNYPFIVGIIYTIYWHYREQNIIVFSKKVVCFVILYFSFLMISVINGAFNYPYFDIFFNTDIHPLPRIIRILTQFGFSTNFAFSIYLVKKASLEILVDLVRSFGLTYLICCWYRNDFKQAFIIFLKGIGSSLLIVLIYGLLDTLSIANNHFASYILITTRPYLHAINMYNEWYPPLLWLGQLRSIFTEPSFFGNYISCVLPLVWTTIIYGIREKLLLFFSGFLTFFTIITSSRTAWFMYLGSMFLMTICTLILKNKIYLKRFLCLLLVSCFSILCGFIFIERISYKDSMIGDLSSTETIIDNNLLSIYHDNTRSNGARYSMIRSGFNVFLQHPALGVGYRLSDAYLFYDFTKQENSNPEIITWMNKLLKVGIINQRVDTLNEYVTRLSEIGLIGTVLFLTPFIIVLFNLLKYIMNNNYYRYPFTSILLSLICSLVVAANVSIYIYESSWILLALGYIGLKSASNISHPVSYE